MRTPQERMRATQTRVESNPEYQKQIEADKAAGKHFAGSKNKKSAHESHMHGGFHGK